MPKLCPTLKGIFTRLLFATHSMITLWQVIIFKKESYYWYMSLPIVLLFIEGFYTLTRKENQEWKWFCPAVFFYLSSVVPNIWLLELHKIDVKLQAQLELRNETINIGTDLNKMLGDRVTIPDMPFSTDTWITIIEQFLMLVLIVGRWLLPKGVLTREQLSQLLLVYIGTAADIIEFFDSFKDEKIFKERVLVMLNLGVWSWSLMQFTVVLTATKSRKSRISSNGRSRNDEDVNCSIDVCAILMNLILQDTPFLMFRMLIIFHYRIVSYMNIFFTAKNTLVILLQLYRLHVVRSEMKKHKETIEKEMNELHILNGGKSKRVKVKGVKKNKLYEIGNIVILTNPKNFGKAKNIEPFRMSAVVLNTEDIRKAFAYSEISYDEDELSIEDETQSKNSEEKPTNIRSKNPKRDAKAKLRPRNVEDDAEAGCSHWSDNTKKRRHRNINSDTSTSASGSSQNSN